MGAARARPTSALRAASGGAVVEQAAGEPAGDWAVPVVGIGAAVEAAAGVGCEAAELSSVAAAAVEQAATAAVAVGAVVVARSGVAAAADSRDRA